MELVEEIVTVDDELRRCEYRINAAPMPLEFDLGTVDVLTDTPPAATGASRPPKPDLRLEHGRRGSPIAVVA